MDYFLSSTIPIQSLKSFIYLTHVQSWLISTKTVQFTQIQKHWSKGNQEGVFVCFVFGVFFWGGAGNHGINY